MRSIIRFMVLIGAVLLASNGLWGCKGGRDEGILPSQEPPIEITTDSFIGDSGGELKERFNKIDRFCAGDLNELIFKSRL